MSGSARRHTHSATWVSKVGGLIMLLGFVPIFSFYTGMQYQRLVDARNASEDQHVRDAASGQAVVPNAQMPLYPDKTDGAHPDNLSNEAAPDLPLSRTFMSQKQTYVFSLYMLSSGNTCAYTLQKEGKTIDITQLVGAATLPCEKTTSGISSGFQKWLDDESFLIEIQGETLKINVSHKTVQRQ